ncbi:MAG: trypsin-like peptidase domain-containing protein [Clostridiales bacterium]|jgi:serine protease Do|nr:trypsin-like peptidase domain-containing protein [Clostridiales bacterium]
MQDYNALYDEGNSITTSEIDRIQQEIDKDLKKADTSIEEAVVQDLAAPAKDDIEPRQAFTAPHAPGDEVYGVPPGSAGTPVYPPPADHTPVYNAPPYPAAVSPGPAPDYTAPLGAPLSPVTNRVYENGPRQEYDGFYNETIKNQSKSRFKRTLALVCAASVLAPSFLGLAIVAGNYVVNRYFSAPAAPYRVDQAAENESAFAFEQSDPSQSIAAEPGTAFDWDQAAEFANIIDKVEPSVVCITYEAQMAQGGFFGMQPQPVSGAGSGIIFHQDSEKVYIATNQHVVSGANSVQVSVSGSELVPARLVGQDAQADLAVISISKADLSAAGVTTVVPADFGDSDKVRVGEPVLAIGNALGEGNTATNGIISAKDKQITIDNRDLTVFQTNAAINPGNSGGPLVNMSGEVIGINTAKLSESSVEGMGYSITSNKAKPIIEELMNQVNRPFLGIQGMDITEQVASLYSLPQMGVIVESVFPGTSAEEAGIKRADIITSFNGKSVLTMEQLSAFIKECAIGDKVEIKLLREGTEALTVTATLQRYGDMDF